MLSQVLGVFMVKMTLLKLAGWPQGESRQVFAIDTLAQRDFPGDFLSASLSPLPANPGAAPSVACSKRELSKRSRGARDSSGGQAGGAVPPAHPRTVPSRAPCRPSAQVTAAAGDGAQDPRLLKRPRIAPEAAREGRSPAAARVLVCPRRQGFTANPQEPTADASGCVR